MMYYRVHAMQDYYFTIEASNEVEAYEKISSFSWEEKGYYGTTYDVEECEEPIEPIVRG
jgi:hypothetical protein